jgi:chromosome segregation ATPase
MKMFAESDSDSWREKLAAYENAQHALLCIQRDVRCLKRRADSLKAEWRLAKAALPTLHSLCGKVSRLVKPLRRRLVELEQAGAPEAEIGSIRQEINCYADAELPKIDGQIVALMKRIEELRTQRARVIQSFRDLEKGSVARDHRAIVERIGLEIHVARLRLASRAFRITRGLPYSDVRPTAWWLPVVDPTGTWFRNVIETTEGSVEPMV